MKKVAGVMLVVGIILSLTLSAWATDEQQGVRVSDLDGLLAAIEAAQDGDTIIVTDQISAGNDAIIGCADKTIIITGAEKHFLNQLFYVDGGNLTMLNLIIDGHGEYGAINFFGNSLTCQNCTFFHCDIGVMMYNKPGEFENCVFDSCSHPLSGANGLTMQGCRISNCTDGGGCITARGNIIIEDSIFEGNCVMKDLGVLFFEAGAFAQIRNSVLRATVRLLVLGQRFTVMTALQCLGVFSTITNLVYRGMTFIYTVDILLLKIVNSPLKSYILRMVMIIVACILII